MEREEEDTQQMVADRESNPGPQPTGAPNKDTLWRNIQLTLISVM